MAERPILFSGEMVRAILEGPKTQTRRVVKPHDPTWTYSVVDNGEDGALWLYDIDDMGDYHRAKCPYGQPGDTLWVRETWATLACYSDVAPRDLPPETPIQYQADLATAHWPTRQGSPLGANRPSIHMPRWASRITLELTGVRVERVREITCEDIQAEGVDLPWPLEYCSADTIPTMRLPDGSIQGPQRGTDAERVAFCVANNRAPFVALWNSLNAKRGFSWESNPWVWALDFRRINTEGE